jgi:hypothetical protein
VDVLVSALNALRFLRLLLRRNDGGVDASSEEEGSNAAESAALQLEQLVSGELAPRWQAALAPLCAAVEDVHGMGAVCLGRLVVDASDVPALRCSLQVALSLLS